MRLRSIWFSRGYSLAERMRRTRDAIFWSLPSLLPLRLRYTTTMREIGKATMTSPNIPATPLDEVLRNLDAPASLS